MSKAKMTPGPWASQGLLVWDANPAGGTICEVNGNSFTTDGKHIRTIGREEGEANAIAIAALPDLIEVLQEIHDDYRTNSKAICEAFGIASLDEWPKMQRIRAALKKAGMLE